MPEKKVQRWDITVHGRHHRVEIDSSGWSRVISWHVDGELVARKKSADDRVQISPGDGLDDSGSDPSVESDPDPGEGAGDLGVIGARFTTLGRARRVTWFGSERLDADSEAADEPSGDEDESGKSPAMVHALLGVGGIDLDPEPGSPAALREQRIRAHPRRYAAIHTAGGVAKVVVPILLGLIAVRIVIDIPWPDWSLPSIPWPNIPWPSVPWPDISLPRLDWQVPGWLRWIAEHAKYVVPILLAWGFAQRELRRRRKQDELKARLRSGSDADTAHPDQADPQDRRDERDGDPRAS